MEGTHNILICDDEREVGELVAHLLEAEGYRASVCEDAEQALLALETGAFDLVILDVMMPNMDGFELIRRLRASDRANVRDIAVIFLSAKVEELDKVIGFTLGADDYVTKPFKPRELVVRVKARLRRKPVGVSASATLTARGIELDEFYHEASLHGEDLALTPKEFDCLAVLLRAGGSPVSARSLFEAVWQTDYNLSLIHI